MHKYNNKSAWWCFCVCGNYAARFYSFSMETVRKLQKKLEYELFSSVEELENEIIDKNNNNNYNEIIDQLTDFTIKKGEYITDEWRKLFPILLTTYRDCCYYKIYFL